MGEIPENCKENIIFLIPIPKKAMIDKLKFRKISSMIHAAKFLVKIISNQIENIVEK